MKLLLSLGLAAIVSSSSLFVSQVSAQSTSYWSQCADGASIVRCETYNCPRGDTNLDGLCDLKDASGVISDSRNDSFCANPPGGCGQVLYYAQGQNVSCAVRVKENENSCNLYKAGNPNFSTPTATPIATIAPTLAPTGASRLGSTVPTTTPKPKDTTLPKTGPELWISIFVAALGMYGLYLYEKAERNTE